MAVEFGVWQRREYRIAHRNQFADVDAGADAHGLEHEYQVLGDHVAGSARRKGTAAQAAQGAVETAHARLVGGERIGKPEAARVVEVRLDGEVLADRLAHFAEQAL